MNSDEKDQDWIQSDNFSGLEDEFPLRIGDFQGRTVNLPEGNYR